MSQETKDATDDFSWGVKRRFEFIEWRCFWTGKVNRKDLESEFNISTQQASIDLSKYQNNASGNIYYDKNAKTYVASSEFFSKFYKPNAERFLLQLQAVGSKAIEIGDTWFDKLPQNDVIPPLIRAPVPQTLRDLIRAIEKQIVMSINYQSFNSASMRAICPHALAYDGYRWHLRALSIKDGEYRDFVLGRITSINLYATSNIDYDHDDDIEWHNKFTFHLVPHPGLTEDARRAVEQDYQIQDGELQKTVRISLGDYFIKRHNLDLRKGEISPERAQLLLKNYDEFQSVKLKAKEESKALISARQVLSKVKTRKE